MARRPLEAAGRTRVARPGGALVVAQVRPVNSAQLATVSDAAKLLGDLLVAGQRPGCWWSISHRMATRLSAGVSPEARTWRCFAVTG